MQRFTQVWLDLATNPDAYGCVLAIIDFGGMKYYVGCKDVFTQDHNGRNIHFQGCILDEITLSDSINPYSRDITSKSVSFTVPMDVVPVIDIRKRRTVLQNGEVSFYWFVDNVGMSLNDAVFYFQGRVTAVEPNEQDNTVTIHTVEKRIQGDKPFPPAIMDGVRVSGVVESDLGKVSPVVFGSVKALPGICIDDTHQASWIVMHDPFKTFTGSPVTDVFEEETSIEDGGDTQSVVADSSDGTQHWKYVLNTPDHNSSVCFDVTGYPVNNFSELINFLLRFSDYSQNFDQDSLNDTSAFLSAISYNLAFNDRVDGGVLSVIRDRLSKQFPFHLVQKGDSYEFIPLRWDREVRKVLSFDKNIIRKVSGPTETSKEETYSEFVIKYGHSLLRDEFQGVLVLNESNNYACKVAADYYGHNAMPAIELRDSDANGAGFIANWYVEAYGKMRLSVSYECTLDAATVSLWDTVKVFDTFESWDFGVLFKVIGIHLGNGNSVVLDLLSLDDVMEVYKEAADEVTLPNVIDAEVVTGDHAIYLDFNVAMENNADLTDAANYSFSGPTTITVNTVTRISETRVKVAYLGAVTCLSNYRLSVSAVVDTAGSEVDPQRNFAYFQFPATALLEVVSATCNAVDDIRIIFSADTENNADLTDASNYAVAGDGSPSVLSVTRISATEVQLELDALTSGESYTVTVSNVVRDAYFVPLDPAHDDASFTYLAPYHNGLVGLWAFKDNLNDDSGNGLTGSWLVGAATYANGTFDRQATNDKSKVISLTNSALLNPSGGITLSVWLTASSQFYQYAAVSRLVTAYTVGSYWLGATTNTGLAVEYAFIIGTGVGSCTLDTLQTTTDSSNAWRHLVGTFDGTNMKIYLNGSKILEKVHSSPGTIYQCTSPTLATASANGVGTYRDFLPGGVEEIAIYNRALSATDVAYIYANSPIPAP